MLSTGDEVELNMFGSASLSKVCGTVGKQDTERNILKSRIVSVQLGCHSAYRVSTRRFILDGANREEFFKKTNYDT